MSTTETRTLLIRAGIKRNYGKHEIYYEISEQIEVANGQERRDAFQNLQAQLEDQISVYEHVSLPHVKLPAGGPADSGSKGTTDTFPVDSITIESVKGKKHIAAMGGKWKKFGVPIYSECETSLDVSLWDYGVHDVAHLGLTAKIYIEGDRAKRVMSIK